MNKTFSKCTLGSRSFSYFSPENVLSKENIKTTIAKFNNLKPIRFHTHQPARKAAVLVPLCQLDNKISLLYTLKANPPQRGQICFPGGLQDVKDKSLEDTALRKIQEDLGIDAKYIDIWTCGNLIITKGDISVMPILGSIKTDFKLQTIEIDPKQVSEVFTVSLENLCDPACLKYTQFRNTYSVPAFIGNNHRIWGITAMITNMCLSSLLPPKAYNHRIKYIPPVKCNKSLHS